MVDKIISSHLPRGYLIQKEYKDPLFEEGA